MILLPALGSIYATGYVIHKPMILLPALGSIYAIMAMTYIAYDPTASTGFYICYHGYDIHKPMILLPALGSIYAIMAMSYISL